MNARQLAGRLLIASASAGLAYAVGSALFGPAGGTKSAQGTDKLLELRLSESATGPGQRRVPRGGELEEFLPGVGQGIGDAPLTVSPPSAFVRAPSDGSAFTPDSPNSTPDPFMYFRRASDLDLEVDFPEHPRGHWMLRTNSLGMRERKEISAEQPDLRILVTGDSHADGVCFNRENFSSRLEVRLGEEREGDVVEVLNCAAGGYTFYNYLGVLEKYLDLEPDVFVVAVFGGNDFIGVMPQFHHFNGSYRPERSEADTELLEQAMSEHSYALAQDFNSLQYFAQNPAELAYALQAARDVSTEIVVTCMRRSIHPIFVYIPAMHEVEWENRAESFEALAEMFDLSEEDLTSTGLLADLYLEHLRSLRVDVLDLRPLFRSTGGNYWLRDHHINRVAHRRIAEALHPLVEAARPAGFVRAAPPPLADGPIRPTDLYSPGSAVEAESLEN